MQQGSTFHASLLSSGHSSSAMEGFESIRMEGRFLWLWFFWPDRLGSVLPGKCMPVLIILLSPVMVGKGWWVGWSCCPSLQPLGLIVYLLSGCPYPGTRSLLHMQSYPARGQGFLGYDCEGDRVLSRGSGYSLSMGEKKGRFGPLAMGHIPSW